MPKSKFNVEYFENDYKWYGRLQVDWSGVWSRANRLRLNDSEKALRNPLLFREPDHLAPTIATRPINELPTVD